MIVRTFQSDRTSASRVGPPIAKRLSTSRMSGRNGGFTFIEIMFAVILLGIGFIMLAAVFPVGIRMQQETLDADNATAIADSAYGMLSAHFASSPLTPPMASTPPTNLNYNAPDLAPIRGSQICTADPRYAWTAVWRNPTATVPVPSGTAIDFYIFVLRSRNQQNYSAAIQSGPTQMDPQLVAINSLTYSALGSQIVLSPAAQDLAEEGAYVVIQWSSIATNVGKIFRLGTRVNEGDNSVWYLSPDSQGTLSPDGSEDEIGGTQAYMVGRGLDPSNTTVHTGPAQDVAVVKKTFVYP